jgi:hypothetical protein
MPSKSGCGGSIAHLLRLSTPTSPSNHTMAAALRNASSSLRAAPLQVRRGRRCCVGAACVARLPHCRQRGWASQVAECVE